jgi:hypothetical protein
MNKSKKYNKPIKKNQTTRRRKIRGGGDYGYDATLVVIPVYDFDEDGQPIMTKLSKLKERFFPTYNLKLGQRMSYVDDLIRLTIDDETLVPKGVIPVVHRLKGRRSQKDEQPVTNVSVTNVPETEKEVANPPDDVTYGESEIKSKLGMLYRSKSDLDKLKLDFKKFENTISRYKDIGWAIRAMVTELQKPENKQTLEEFMKRQ